jgi:hypothetical protein
MSILTNVALKLKIENLHQDSSVWKELVWMNRSGRDLVAYNEPQELVRQLIVEGRDLVTGPISSNAGLALNKMNDYSDMTEDNVFKFDEGKGLQPAMQYSFQSKDKKRWKYLSNHTSLKKVVLSRWIGCDVQFLQLFNVSEALKGNV